MDHRGNRLTIDFTGLCVFVTNAPDETLKVILAGMSSGTHVAGAATGMDGMAHKGIPVAPAADADRVNPRKEDHSAHAGPMKHRPIVSFDAKYLRSFSGPSKVPVIQTPNGDQIASWGVENRIVTMHKWSGAYPAKVVRCQAASDLPLYPRDPMAEMDVRWVPSLKVLTGAERVRAEYLEPDPSRGGANTALAARFDLESGYLFSHAEANRRNPMDLWEFKDEKGTVKPHTQYLGDTLRLELHSASSTDVVLEARAFSDSSDVETLKLKFQDGQLEIAVTNFPEGLQPGTPLAHFPTYYDFLENPLRRPKPEKSAKALSDWVEPAANKGVTQAVAQNIQQVKCTPGMVP